MNENIQISFFDKKDADIDRITELYCLTFIGDDFSPQDHEDADGNILKHASYEGFKGVKAKNVTGNLVGFAYGYTSLPEQFYRKKIERQLTEQEKRLWLQDCFEFVELAVSPLFKRNGFGRLLHDKLLDEVEHKHAILTTSIDNEPAINLYKRKGWQMIKEDAAVVSTNDLQCIMGKRLKA